MLWTIPLISFMIAWELVARIGIFPANRLPAFTTVLATMCKCLMIQDFTLRVLRSFMNLSIGDTLSVVFGSASLFDRWIAE